MTAYGKHLKGYPSVGISLNELGKRGSDVEVCEITHRYEI